MKTLHLISKGKEEIKEQNNEVKYKTTCPYHVTQKAIKERLETIDNWNISILISQANKQSGLTRVVKIT